MSARIDLGSRLAGLRRAVEVLDRLPPGTLDGPDEQALSRASAVLTNAGRRRELSAEHTVVALAGATGSGKSSLLNALAGVSAATVGVRRPTTSHPLALLWGAEGDGARPLLDWLEVDRRHEVDADAARRAGWPPGLDGLILLDLPDIDSVDPDHRRRAARLADSVDVLVWVLDPQKYADAVVHAEFLAPMARHAEVTLVVLNQIDRLAEADRAPVLADLRDLLTDDGLRGVRVVPASALTGEGLADVRSGIAAFVEDRRAADARLAADVATAADRLRGLGAEVASGVPADLRRRLVAALVHAAGVNRVADAVAGSFRGRARARTGWPMVRWLGRFRADPLRRLHLDAGSTQGHAELAVSSMPRPGAAQQAQVHTALRDLGDRASEETEEPWRGRIRAAAMNHGDSLADDLDQAIVRTPIPGRTDPWWFGVIGALQWLVFAVLVVGVVWLGVYAVLGYLRIELPWVPVIGPVPAAPPLPELPQIPWPTALVLVGAVVGIAVALLCGVAARVGAARRRRRARAELTASIQRVADRVVGEVESAMALPREVAAGLSLAAGRTPRRNPLARSK